MSALAIVLDSLDNQVLGFAIPSMIAEWKVAFGLTPGNIADITMAIPSIAIRRTPYPLDRKAYRRRNVIEQMFCKLKNWRRIAIRYDRLAQNYLSGVALVAVVSLWI